MTLLQNPDGTWFMAEDRNKKSVFQGTNRNGNITVTVYLVWKAQLNGYVVEVEGSDSPDEKQAMTVSQPFEDAESKYESYCILTFEEIFKYNVSDVK